MKRQIGLATATAALFAASLVAAQTPPTTTGGTQSRMSADSVTVTGCLQPGSNASSSTSTTASSSMNAAYILTNATKDAKGTTGTTGTTATNPPSSASAAMTYSLVGSDSDLKKHVGHKVEVTGKIDTSSANRPAATTGTATATGDAHPTPRLEVSSVRM